MPQQREQGLARRKEQDGISRAQVRAEETPEQREQRLAREREQGRARQAQIRDHRAEETPQQREQRLARPPGHVEFESEQNKHLNRESKGY